MKQSPTFWREEEVVALVRTSAFSWIKKKASLAFTFSFQEIDIRLEPFKAHTTNYICPYEPDEVSEFVEI